MKNTILLLSFLALSACASQSVNYSEVEQSIETNQDTNLEGKHRFKLDYLVNDNIYSYSTYEIKNKNRYIQLLAQDGELISISTLENTNQAYSPPIRKCTLFPFRTEIDSHQCLVDFNETVIQANNENLLNDISNKDEQNNKYYGGHVFTILASPVIVPAALLATPVAIADYKSTSGKRKSFTLQLGENENLSDYLMSLNQKHVSETNNSGTAYLGAGIFNAPALAFGYSDNKVIWIQMDPTWSCGGGIMFWGHTCTVGDHGFEYLYNEYFNPDPDK